MTDLPIEIIHKIELYAIDVKPAAQIKNVQKKIEKSLCQYPELYESYKQSFDGKGVWNFQCILLNELLSLLEYS